MLLRTGLLRAAHSTRLRRFAEESAVVSRVVDRFVAGASETDALRTTHELLAGGRMVTLDLLGEDVICAQQAAATTANYTSLLSALGDTAVGQRAEVSVKLSALGQRLPHDGYRVALDNARKICQAAAQAGTTVTLDMEDHTTTDATLAVLAQLRADHPATGVAVQAYLHRTEADCHDLAAAGARVRLCKGAYAEPVSVAYRGTAVAESFHRCLQALIDGAAYPMIASHDPQVIARALDVLEARSRPADSYEFQMLNGVRPDQQRSLAVAGHRMRVYVPYGGEWYGYFMRRLAERPANLRLFLRAAVAPRPA